MVGAKSVKIFIRKNQINRDEFATLEIIPSKYEKYNDVFEEPEKKIHCQDILKTITKSFWKHRKNWQPILITI